MVRVRGVYLRKPPKGPSAYTSKEAALAANPTMLTADAAFPKNRLESVKNAALRVNSGGRDEWSSEEFFAIWEYAKDVVLRIKRNEEGEDESIEALGFLQDGKVIGDDGVSIGTLKTVPRGEGESVETGGWVLLIGVQPHVPEGWEEIVNSSRRRKRKQQKDPEAGGE